MDMAAAFIIVVAFLWIIGSITSMEKDFNRRLDIVNRDIEKIERLNMALLEQLSTTHHLLEDYIKSNRFRERYDDEP
jgi:F0F1-type ATP synthase membrane subunit b/b'